MERVHFLLNCLEHSDKETRCQAVFELWGFDSLDDASLQQIRRYEDDSYIYVRLFVGEIIWKHCGDPSALIHVATDFIGQNSEFSQTVGLELLRSIGPAAASGTYAARPLLYSKNPIVRDLALSALNEIEAESL